MCSSHAGPMPSSSSARQFRFAGIASAEALWSVPQIAPASRWPHRAQPSLFCALSLALENSAHLLDMGRQGWVSSTTAQELRGGLHAQRLLASSRDHPSHPARAASMMSLQHSAGGWRLHSVMAGPSSAACTLPGPRWLEISTCWVELDPDRWSGDETYIIV